MNTFAAGVEYLELQAAIVRQPVDRSAVSARDGHRCLENHLEQAVNILLAAEPRGDFQQTLRYVFVGVCERLGNVGRHGAEGFRIVVRQIAVGLSLATILSEDICPWKSYLFVQKARSQHSGE